MSALRKLRTRIGGRPRALLVGWFSLPFGGATAGDLSVLGVVRGWLDEAGVAYDVALGTPFEGGVAWDGVEPRRYSHVVHVCGPAAPDLELSRVFERFPDARRIGVNVSLVRDPADWNPFSEVIARDGNGRPRADLAFAAAPAGLPAVGVLLVHPQLEYAGGRHEQVDRAVWDLVSRRRCAPLALDSRLDFNAGGLRSAAELEALVARMDALLTTRLHGLVFALRNGVPALAVDPIPGGAKVSAQAQAIGWPGLVGADELERLDEGLEWCLGSEARTLAQKCGARGAEDARRVREELLSALGRRT